MHDFFMGDAVDEPQAELVQTIRSHRNEVAHELPKLLIDPKHAVNATLLERMNELISALGKFWARIEVETDSELDTTTRCS